MFLEDSEAIKFYKIIRCGRKLRKAGGILLNLYCSNALNRTHGSTSEIDSIMNQHDVVQRLCEIEAEHNCFDIRAGDTPIWEYIRPQIITRARRTHTTGEAADVDTNTNLKTKIRYFVELIRNTAAPKFSPISIPEVDVLLFGFARRSRENDGEMWDIISDPIIDLLNNSGMTCALLEDPIFSDQNLHCDNNHTQNQKLFYNDFVYFAPNILSKINTGGYKLTQAEYNELVGISKIIDKNIGTNMSEWIVSEAEKEIEARKIKVKLYDCILKRSSPSLLLVVNRDAARPLIESAKKQQVPVAELQHGTINNLHPGFRFPDGVAPETLPTAFLSWGDAWAESVNVPMLDMHVIGHPYSNEKVSRVNSARETSSDRIVVLSQFFCGTRLANLALKLGEEVENTEIIFKPHPGVGSDWRSCYPQLQQSNVRVIAGEQADLYELLGTARGQVGVSSTALYEGLRFGLHTYIVDEYTRRYMDPVVNRGYADIVSTASEILADYNSHNSINNVDMEPWFAEVPDEEIATEIAELS